MLSIGFIAALVFANSIDRSGTEVDIHMQYAANDGNTHGSN